MKVSLLVVVHYVTLQHKSRRNNFFVLIYTNTQDLPLISRMLSLICVYGSSGSPSGSSPRQSGNHTNGNMLHICSSIMYALMCACMLHVTHMCAHTVTCVCIHIILLVHFTNGEHINIQQFHNPYQFTLPPFLLCTKYKKKKISNSAVNTDHT